MKADKHNSKGFWDWFNPAGRDAGGWAFILNRISALGLAFYLYLHLFVLGKLAQGPEAFDQFIAAAKSPLYTIGELLVIAAALYHGLNGVRLVLNSFSIGVPRQKQMFYTALLLTVIVTILFAARMFTAP
ncbi:MAG: succinate dehydrogenase, cytochrome b556 subunit [Caldilineae bacterium]|nr:MAG: succinate dehydrogenase, cytochrome b556 subunit [Caldilineae bacterium]